MPTQLNQIVAKVNGVKSRAQGALTQVYHKLQKHDALCTGIERKYRPKDDDGEVFPSEGKLVQYTVPDAISEARKALEELIDTVATQDTANCRAVADVDVDGTTVLSSVPVTHLLFLEKQLNDIHSLVNALPTLDPAETWESSTMQGVYKTKPRETTKTKKVLRNHIKYEATKEHPAQVDTYAEDVTIGYWDTTVFSGAIPAQQKTRLMERVHELQDAVKAAREKANAMEVTGNTRYGGQLLDYVFEGA